ncbi:thioesterase family protein [Nocardioides sp.]|uniref:thioesterase family protein n=1 Tax=Nocardioides sp. TaxID=35761 RepID=UPI0035172457
MVQTAPAVQMSYFVRDGDALAPTELARGSWATDSLHGVALCGALGRAAERTVARLGRLAPDDLRAARITVDLFAAPGYRPCELATEVVREGRRICLVDVRLTQGGKRVARASVLFLKATASAPGEVWTSTSGHTPPPLDVAPPTDQPRVPFVRSGADWSQDFSQHQDAARKITWNSAVPIVAGEPLTPFQAVAAIADGTNLAASWGAQGVQHINTDVTLVLAREPIGTEIGLAVTERLESDGIAVASAEVFDRQGALGITTITTLANVHRSIDMGARDYADDPRSRS